MPTYFTTKDTKDTKKGWDHADFVAYDIDHEGHEGHEGQVIEAVFGAALRRAMEGGRTNTKDICFSSLVFALPPSVPRSATSRHSTWPSGEDRRARLPQSA